MYVPPDTLEFGVKLSNLYYVLYAPLHKYTSSPSKKFYFITSLTTVILMAPNLWISWHKEGKSIKTLFEIEHCVSVTSRT